MRNYFIRNRETDRLELHFDKAAYKGLSNEKRAEVKSYFLWNRQAEAWVSKAHLQGGTTGAYYPTKIATGLGLTDGGESGERKTVLQQQLDKNQKLDRKKAYFGDVDESTFIEWEQYIPSKSLNDRHNSVSFYDHDYPRDFKNDLNETIADIKQRLNVSSENALPTYVKTAIERYAKSLSEYYAKYVNNRTYAPSPMVVGPAKYPWHRLDKVHDRDGRNFANLDEARAKLKAAVNRAHPDTFVQRTDPAYLMNRISETQAQVRAMERGVKSGKHLDFYETRLTQYKELLAYWQDQLADTGGLLYSKQSLKDAGATHIKYGGKYYPIIRLSDNTVTIGKWFNDNPKITFSIPYAKISGYTQRWEDALLKKPGEKTPKVKKEKIEKAFTVGDQALLIRYGSLYLVRVKVVGREYYTITGAGIEKVKFDDLKPLSYGYQERLDQLLIGAESYRAKIIDSLQHPDDSSKMDIKHFLDYGRHPYRHNVKLLQYDLVEAGYPEKGGVIAFFRDKYGLDNTIPKGASKTKSANKVKNATYRAAGSKIKAIRKVASTKGKSGATKLKSRLDAARERIAERRGVEPEKIKVYLDPDTNRVTEKRLKTVVSNEKAKRAAIKSGKVSSKKAKLTKAERDEIKRKAIQQAELASGKKKPLTAEQVIKIGRKINFDRFHIVIDGQVYNIREDFDTPVTNKRRLAPTEDNLLKWARNPGRYDLIGVDAAGKVNVTVHKKRDKDVVPKRLSYPAKQKALQIKKARTTKKRPKK